MENKLLLSRFGFNNLLQDSLLFSLSGCHFGNLNAIFSLFKTWFSVWIMRGIGLIKLWFIGSKAQQPTRAYGPFHINWSDHNLQYARLKNVRRKLALNFWANLRLTIFRRTDCKSWDVKRILAITDKDNFNRRENLTELQEPFTMWKHNSKVSLKSI